MPKKTHEKNPWVSLLGEKYLEVGYILFGKIEVPKPRNLQYIRDVGPSKKKTWFLLKHKRLAPAVVHASPALRW